MIHNNNVIVGNNAKSEKKAVKSKTGKVGGKLQRKQQQQQQDLPEVTVTKEYYKGIPTPGFLSTKIVIKNQRPISQQQRKARFVKKGIRYYNSSGVAKKNMEKMLMEAKVRSGIAAHHDDGALEVSFKFEFKLPVRNKDDLKKGDAYEKKVDLDNLQKFMLDAMTGIFYGDDSTVCTMSAHKVYGDVDATTVYIWKHCKN